MNLVTFNEEILNGKLDVLCSLGKGLFYDLCYNIAMCFDVSLNAADIFYYSLFDPEKWVPLV